MDKIRNISQKVAVPEKLILDMLFVLSDGSKVENNELIRKVGVSKNALNHVKAQLSEYLHKPSQHTQLSDKGVSFVRSLISEGYASQDSMYKVFEGETYKKIVDLLIKHKDTRSTPKRQIDQVFAIAETSARKASLMNFLGDIDQKRTLMLGDDDLVSIGVASQMKAKSIDVLDLDNDIIETVRNIEKAENYHINSTSYDARNNLPNEFAGKFDVVFTDPPYTPEGVELFLSRAISALDPKNPTGRIYLCYGNSDNAKERFLLIYRAIVNSGLFIRFIFDKFNRYNGAESIGSTSSIFVLERTPMTKPTITGVYKKSIYSTKNYE